jgi:hypothetical protein
LVNDEHAVARVLAQQALQHRELALATRGKSAAGSRYARKARRPSGERDESCRKRDQPSGRAHVDAAVVEEVAVERARLGVRAASSSVRSTNTDCTS